MSTAARALVVLNHALDIVTGDTETAHQVPSILQPAHRSMQNALSYKTCVKEEVRDHFLKMVKHREP